MMGLCAFSSDRGYTVAHSLMCTQKSALNTICKPISGQDTVELLKQGPDLPASELPLTF